VPDHPRRILLVRTDRLGDVVLTLPAVHYLRERFPHAKVTLLVRPYVEPLLRCHDGLDSVLLYRPEAEHRGLLGHLRLARELRGENFSQAYLFHPRPELAFALRAAGIPEVVGTGYRWYSLLFSHRVYLHRRRGQRHELDCNLALVADALGERWDGGPVDFGLRDGTALREARCRALSDLGIRGSYAVVHPGSGGSAPRLPPEMFARVAAYLAQAHPGLSVVVAGVPEEGALVAQVAGAPAACAAVRGVTGWDLHTYQAVLAGASLLVSNSTGPLHVARAFATPVVGFYCRATPCHPRRWGPYGLDGSVVLPAMEECEVCRPERCCHGNCLERIPWDEIRAALDREWAGAGAPSHGASGPIRDSP
jgi:ADP-heptose:LPS heptosyltransferase